MKKMDRRPIKTRSAGWANHLARRAAALGISPNQISLSSILFGVLGAACLLRTDQRWALIVAAACVQLRLLANLLDGMVAIEEGRQSALGPLYNELPDRVTDSLFLVALGYAAGCPGGGWACALLAALTAYVRVLGGALGQMQDFRGPMAKSHRMAALTVACVCAAVPSSVSARCEVLMAAIAVIAAGSLVTIINRARLIGSQLRAES